MTPTPCERILIVEDNALNTKLFAALLRSEGRELHMAGSAEAALEMLEWLAPQLIVLDMQLPEMSGYDLALKLKADPKTSDIAIVAATASAMVGDDVKALAAGCDAYVTKPIDGPAFLFLVTRLLAVRASLRSDSAQ